MNLQTAAPADTIAVVAELDPILLETGLLEESLDIAKKYADRADLSRIPCVSYWNDARRALASAR